MKSYVTIRDKCDYKYQSNIISHLRSKYNIIRFMEININSYYPRLRREDPNKVSTHMHDYSSFQNYKIINGNYSIYNYTKNNQKIRNSIHNIATRHTYPIDKRVKITPKLTERFSIK